MNLLSFKGNRIYRWFSRYVIAAMLVDGKQKIAHYLALFVHQHLFISPYCYLCLPRLHENHLFGPAQYVKCRRLFLELNSQGFYSGWKRGREIRRHISTSSIKRQIRRFYVVVVKWMSKKCTKKRDARAELLFWSLNLLCFELIVVVVVVVA